MKQNQKFEFTYWAQSLSVTIDDICKICGENLENCLTVDNFNCKLLHESLLNTTLSLQLLQARIAAIKVIIFEKKGKFQHHKRLGSALS